MMDRQACKDLILVELVESGYRSVQDIADGFGLDCDFVGSCLNELEREGFVASE